MPQIPSSLPAGQACVGAPNQFWKLKRYYPTKKFSFFLSLQVLFLNCSELFQIHLTIFCSLMKTKQNILFMAILTLNSMKNIYSYVIKSLPYYFGRKKGCLVNILKLLLLALALNTFLPKNFIPLVDNSYENGATLRKQNLN